MVRYSQNTLQSTECSNSPSAVQLFSSRGLALFAGFAHPRHGGLLWIYQRSLPLLLVQNSALHAWFGSRPTSAAGIVLHRRTRRYSNLDEDGRVRGRQKRKKKEQRNRKQKTGENKHVSVRGRQSQSPGRHRG